MKLRCVFALLGLSIVCSCGPSADEIAREQKRKDDSSYAAGAAKTEQKNEVQRRFKVLKNRYQAANAQLAAEEDKLDRIKDFHLLRSDEKREEQIQQQTLYITKLKENIGAMEDDLNKLQQELANN